MENKTSLRHPIFHHSICFTLQQFNILKEVPLTWFIPLAISFWNRGKFTLSCCGFYLLHRYPQGRQEAGNFEKRLLVSRGELTCSPAKPQGTLPSVSSFPYLLPSRGTGDSASCWKPLPRHAMNSSTDELESKKQHTTVCVWGSNCYASPDEITFKISLCLLLCLLHLGKRIV